MVNIAVSNVQIRIYLFLKLNAYILNIEVFCSTILLDKNLGIKFQQVIMDKDNQTTSHIGDILEAIPYNLNSMLFFPQRSMKIEPQKESSKLIGKECENDEKKNKVLKKL